jgi:hypothetical protein
MPQLIVRQIEERVVKSSGMAYHMGCPWKRNTAASCARRCWASQENAFFQEHLLSMPNVGEDKDFERGPQIERPIEL